MFHILTVLSIESTRRKGRNFTHCTCRSTNNNGKLKFSTINLMGKVACKTNASADLALTKSKTPKKTYPSSLQVMNSSLIFGFQQALFNIATWPWDK